MASKGTPATVLLNRQKVSFTTYEYQVDPRTPAYGAAVAAALGVPVDRVFKTLVAVVDGRLAVGMVPVAATLDLKAVLGGKRGAMAEPAVAERATGYVTGGISPFGQRSRLPMVLDRSAVTLPTVFVSGGRRGLQLAVAPDDLLRVTGATVAAIAVHHR